ncbi:MAG: hypothetical protein INF43_02885 [Alphaproteobacteria bacterium]|nr:hypothetical protein [Alphaproteobacteria bacterium]
MATMPDFVARAGSYIDRAHRVAGFLLICCAVLGLMTFCQWQRNAELNNLLEGYAQRLPVIVVPGAVAGKYDPREDAQLVAAFADFVTQTFNTFTPETVKRQVESIRPYLAPALLVDSEPYFAKKIDDATSVKRSSLFVPDKASLEVKNYTENGVDLRDVVLRGVLKNIAAGTLAEDVPLEVRMTFQKGIINPNINPFGFQLVRYQEKPIVKDAPPEQIDTSGPTPTAAPAPQGGL